MTDDDPPPLAHKVKRPFAWIGSASHDASSWPFLERQRKRIAEANAERERRKEESIVTELKRKSK